MGEATIGGLPIGFVTVLETSEGGLSGMSDARIKFRCFQCNRLLGVSASKAGKIVACPKCSAELLVPVQTESEGESGSQRSLIEVDPANVFRNLISNQPEPSVHQQPLAPPAPQTPEPARQPSPFPILGTPAMMDASSPTFTSKSGPTEPEPANPFSFLQTEEPGPLRAEPTSRRPRAAEPATPAPPAPPPQAEAPAFPTLQTDAPAQRPEPPRPARPKPVPAPPSAVASPPKPPEPPPPAPKSDVQPPAFVPTPSPPPVEEPIFPSIQVEPQPLRDEPPPLIPPVRVEPSSDLTHREPPPRRNDVSLPRTAVILWSFLVLMALVLAFTTGLLAGHFLWKTAPTAAVQAPEPTSPAPDRT